MFRSKSDLNRVRRALTGAFLLALMVAGVLGSPRVVAARSTTHAAGLAAPGGSTACAVEMQSSDYYLRQEEDVLSKVGQGNWNAAGMASTGGSTACAAGIQSSDYYFRQEQAVLGKVTQGNWNAAEMASLFTALNLTAPETAFIPVTGAAPEVNPALYGGPDYANWDIQLREQYQITEAFDEVSLAGATMLANPPLFAGPDYSTWDFRLLEHYQITEEYPYTATDYARMDLQERQRLQITEAYDEVPVAGATLPANPTVFGGHDYSSWDNNLRE